MSDITVILLTIGFPLYWVGLFIGIYQVTTAKGGEWEGKK